MTDLSGERAMVAICVPIRDEARNLPGLIRALSGQTGVAGVPVRVALLFDGCTDGGDALLAGLPAAPFALATRRIERHALPHAGRARSAALALGLEGFAENGLLLTTDADTRPARDWVAATIAAMHDADLVCGHVQRRDRAADPARLALEVYLARLHAVQRRIDPIPHDPAPNHAHGGGASLAITAAAYRAIGGLPDLPSGEDRALVEHARRAGFRVRHDPAVRVVTSSRIRGRATGGLADAIRGGRDGAQPIVEHPDDAVRRYRIQAAARSAFATIFQPGAADRLAAQTGLPTASIHAHAAAPSADSFVLDLVPDRVEDSRPVALAQTSSLLAAHEAACEGLAA